jgi:hypothetical protein
MSLQIGTPPPPVHPQEFSPTRSGTSALCDKYRIINELVTKAIHLEQTAYNHGANYFCAVAVTYTGLSICTGGGGALLGLALTSLGAKGIYNTLPDGPASDLQKILKNAEAGVEMIEVLETSNNESLSVVKNHLKHITERSEELEGQIRVINSISDNGMESLKDQKQRVSSLYEKSIAHFNLARAEYMKTRDGLDTARLKFGALLKLSEEFLAPPTDKEGSVKKKLKTFLSLSERMKQACEEGKAALDRGESALNKGAELYEKALGFQVEMSFAAGQTILIAERIMEEVKIACKISDMEVANGEAQKKVQNLESKLDLIRYRSNLILNEAKEVKADLAAALKKPEGIQWSTLTLGSTAGIYTARAVAFLFPSLMGTALLVIGAIAGTGLLHWWVTFTKMSRKVSTFCVQQLNISETDRVEDLISVKKNMPSLGNLERAIKQVPYLGNMLIRLIDKIPALKDYTNLIRDSDIRTLSIHLGDEKVELSCQLSEKAKISKPDLLELSKRMYVKLMNGSLTGQRCLKIISQLESGTIGKSFIRKESDPIALITSDSPYFYDIKLLAPKEA